MTKSPSTIQILRSIGISPPYASQIVSGDRKPSLKLALKIYEKTGLKFGEIESASPREIETFSRVMARSA